MTLGYHTPANAKYAELESCGSIEFHQLIISRYWSLLIYGSSLLLSLLLFYLILLSFAIFGPSRLNHWIISWRWLLSMHFYLLIHLEFTFQSPLFTVSLQLLD